MSTLHLGMHWWGIGCSRQGAAHQRHSLPCQDHHAILAMRDGLCLSVADGHGDSEYDQCERGAALASSLAVQEAREWNDQTLPHRILRHWRLAVRRDARSRCIDANPITCLYRRYGTTLLVASIQTDTLSVLGVGDGDLVVVREDGRVDHPLPEDGCLGNETYSLAADSTAAWRGSANVDVAGALVMVVTDGIVTAFPDQVQFDVFARSLSQRVRDYPLTEIALALPDWLDRCSRDGSGDDVTMILAGSFTALGKT